LSDIRSGIATVSKPTESRRWLQPQVSKEQIHRMEPRSKPEALSAADYWERTRRAIRAWWIWLAAGLVLYGAGVWYLAVIAGAIAFVFYHTTAISHPVLYALEPNVDADSPEFRNTMAGMTGMPLIEGNRLEIYNDGDQFYPAMLDAIESARYSVTMEQFIFWDGRVGRRFADVLAGKALEGVCQLAWFRPIHWYTLNRANLRTHRKSLIVDGRVAFTGGAGLADHWLGTAANEREIRDVEIRVEGPAVAVQQSGFTQNWLLSTGEILSGPEFFPTPQISGDVEVQTILSSPSSGAGAAAAMYLIAVQCARQGINKQRQQLHHARSPAPQSWIVCAEPGEPICRLSRS
jgi:hypothetical protein